MLLEQTTCQDTGGLILFSFHASGIRNVSCLRNRVNEWKAFIDFKEVAYWSAQGQLILRMQGLMVGAPVNSAAFTGQTNSS
ncbi:MAG TPA: hypothetical protein DD856_16880 [Sulfobacillus sp.]|nr:hypothetical protein [Sulfobacillus sp.]